MRKLALAAATTAAASASRPAPGWSIRHSTASVQPRVDRSVAMIDNADGALSHAFSWLPLNARLGTCSSTKGGNSRMKPVMVAMGVASANISERQRALPRAA